jgi:FkbM family methyltransferase
MSLRRSIKKSYHQLLQRISKSDDLDLELSVIASSQRSVPGITNIFGKPFKYHDGPCFVSTYKELFQSDIYRFSPSPVARTILDCGANMGLSVLYFSRNYPDHHIIAFEPDPEIFNILRENVETFNMKNVTLHQKAVWNKTETLKFYADGRMGGRVETSNPKSKPVEIEAVALADYIDDHVDLLKIDIEGAEGVVLNSCKGSLHQVKSIFFEYHNSVKESQSLHKLLELIHNEGFIYYVKESDIRERPFIDEHKIGGIFNMALNVFCYKAQ